MPEIKFHNPATLGKPLGQYSQITRVKAAEFLFIAGQVAAEKSGTCVGKDDFDAQCQQVFANIDAALKSQGASFANVVEFTTYLVHSQDVSKFMKFRLREFPRIFPNGAYPPNTLLIVDRLVQSPLHAGWARRIALLSKVSTMTAPARQLSATSALAPS